MSTYTGSKARTGNATIVSIGPRTDLAGGSPAYIPILELKATSNSGEKWDKKEVTNFNSPGNLKEWRKALLDGGVIGFEGNDIRGDDGQKALKVAHLDPNGAYLFKIQYALAEDQSTTGDVETFDGLVESFTPKNEVGEIRTISVSVQITSPTDFVAGS